MRHGRKQKLDQPRLLILHRLLRRFIYLIATLEVLFGICKLLKWW